MITCIMRSDRFLLGCREFGQNECDGGTGLTTEEMTGANAEENMDGFNFEEIWETVEEDDVDANEDGYPILQDLSREEQLDLMDEDSEGIPRFTSALLVLSVVIAAAIYNKKKVKKFVASKNKTPLFE